MKRSSPDDSDCSTNASKRRKINTETTEIIEISDDEWDLLTEDSPSDSGFKEPSTVTRLSSPISISDTSTHIENRGSQRIKQLQEYEDHLSPTERILKSTLKRQNMIHPLESSRQAMDRFNPTVKCLKWSKMDITTVLALDKILPKIERLPNEIEFHGVILNEWRNFDGQDPCYFVRWLPANILDDEWILGEYAKVIGLRRKIKIAELNTRQRRAICERVMKSAKYQNEIK